MQRTLRPVGRQATSDYYASRRRKNERLVERNLRPENFRNWRSADENSIMEMPTEERSYQPGALSYED